jgi:type I restriction enzyme S subunit
MSVPKLRFKEFDGDWTKVSLDKVSKVFDGTHQTPNYVESGIKFVSVENIHAPYDSDKFITVEAFKKDFKNQPQLNDILMTRITAGEIGATAIVDDREPLAYYVSLALIRPKAVVTTPFLNQYIGTPFFKNELHKRIIHVAFPKKINLGDINECLVSLPDKKEEQTKIASFLSAVDEKISQLTQKHELLSQYKQGMMQKLFSQQIRFKADDGSEFGEWGNSYIGDVCKITTGNKDTQNKVDDGEYPFFVRSQTVERINSYSMDCEAVLTSGDGVGVGKNYHYINGKFDFHQRVYCLFDFSESILGKYLYIYFSSYFYDRVKRLSAKNSVDSVRMDMISKMEIQLPCLEEQTKIANFLSAIDQKIEVVAQQIEQAKQWKKGLLQQMFV